MLARAHESIGPWGNALLTLANVADFVIATPSFIFCVDTEQSVDATRLTECLHVVASHVDGECTVAVDNPALCADHRVCSTNGIRTLQHRTYRTVTSPNSLAKMFALYIIYGSDTFAAVWHYPEFNDHDISNEYFSFKLSVV